VVSALDLDGVDIRELVPGRGLSLSETRAPKNCVVLDTTTRDTILVACMLLFFAGCALALESISWTHSSLDSTSPHASGEVLTVVVFGRRGHPRARPRPWACRRFTRLTRPLSHDGKPKKDCYWHGEAPSWRLAKESKSVGLDSTTRCGRFLRRPSNRDAPGRREFRPRPQGFCGSPLLRILLVQLEMVALLLHVFTPSSSHGVATNKG